MEPVYSPSDDSWLLEECILREDLRGKKCLDLGCGSGIQSVAMLRAGAVEVLAVDVNESALRETEKKVNAFLKETKKSKTQLLGHFLGVRKSNLFNNLHKEKFDFVAFNPPYVPTAGIKWRDTDGGKKGMEVIDKFLAQIKLRLNKKGVMFLLLSSLNGVSKISSLLKNKGFVVKVAGRKKLFFEELIVLRAELK